MKKKKKKEIRGCPFPRPMCILLHLTHEQGPSSRDTGKAYFHTVKISWLNSCHLKNHYYPLTACVNSLADTINRPPTILLN